MIFTKPAHRVIAAPGGPITQGLIGHWPLNDGPGSSTAAEVIGGLDGTLSGFTNLSTAWVAGRYGGNALDFGQNDGAQIDVPTGKTLLNGRSDFSLCVHLRLVTDTWSFFSAWFGGSNNSMLLRGRGGSGRFIISPNVDISPSYTPTLNDWMSVAITCDGGLTTFWIDAVAQSPTDTGGVVTATPDDNLQILGGNSAFSVYNINGLADDARIYDRPLSQSELAQIRDGTG